MPHLIGSNIVNVSLIMGVSILIFPVRIGTEKTQKNNLILLFLTIFFIGIFFLPYPIQKTLGFVLIFFYAIFFITEIVWGEEGSKNEDKKALAKLEKSRDNPFLYLAGILISITGLIFSSKYLVSSVISISQIFKINQEIIGLSLVAVGTSLPELATTIASGLKKDWKLLYGDIQGSNIYNLSVIGSILIVLGSSNSGIDQFSLIFMGLTIFSIIALSHKYMGTTIPRIYGVLYILSYAFYIFKIYKF
jgi:cation:H+ antiporter